MNGYTQLSWEQRYQIYALLQTDQNQSQMAQVVGVHKSTISRELRRNRGQRGYRPHQAHPCAQTRQASKHRPRLSQTAWDQVAAFVRAAWSPEQICGRLYRAHGLAISHEWISPHIYEDKRRGGICPSPCGARRSGGNALARIADEGASPIKFRLMSDLRW